MSLRRGCSWFGVGCTGRPAVGSLAAACLLGAVWLAGAPGEVLAQPMVPRERVPQSWPQSLRTRIFLLYSKQPWTRWRAARELGGEGQPDMAAWRQHAEPAIPFLISMLGDSQYMQPQDADPVVKVAWPEGKPYPQYPAEGAAEALGLLGKPVVAPLTTMIARGPTGFFRKHAKLALSKITDDEASRDLVRAVQTSTADVRDAAMIALRGPAGRVSHLLPALGANDTEVRLAIVYALGGKQQRAASDALIAATRDLSPKVRRQAVVSLGELKIRRALDDLVAVLRDDPEASVRAAAAAALGQFPDHGRDEALVGALKDKAPAVRRNALIASVYLNDPTVKDHVLEMLNDPAPVVRAAAVAGSVVFSDHRAVNRLIRLLADRDFEVRRNAIVALRKLRPVNASEGLIQVMKQDSEFSLRQLAADALVRIADPIAIDGLLEQLQSKEPRDRLYAAQAIGQVTCYRAVPRLMGLLNDKHDQIRSAAAQALLRCAHEGVGSFGENLAKWEIWWVDEKSAAERYMRDLRQGVPRQRADAAFALRLNRDGRVVAALLQALNDASPKVRAAAAKALGFHRHPQTTPTLINVLKNDSDQETLQQASLAIYSMRDTQAAPDLIALALVGDSRHRRLQAIRALGYIGDPRAIGPLIGLLRDSDPTIHPIAGEALRQMTGLNFGGSEERWEQWWRDNQKYFIESPSDNR